MSGRAPLWVIVLLSVVAAPIIGVMDYRATEVQPAVLLLLVCSAAVSWLQPRYAWLVALMLGLSIVETHFVGAATGKTPVTSSSSPLGGLLALIPASIGAAVGAMLGVAAKGVSRPRA
jgi:hypothetical protein